MKHRIRTITALFMTLVLILGVSGCGGSSSSHSAGQYMVAETAAASARPQAMYDSAVYESGSMAMNTAGAPAPEAAAGGSTGVDLPEGKNVEGDVPLSRKLIRTVDLQMQTREYESFVAGIKARIDRYEGWIEYSEESGRDYYSTSGRTAYINARIPQDKLSAFLDEGFEGAAVTSRSEQSEDVTLKYSDIEAHIVTLKTEQERMLELLAQADSIESVIALESKLSEIKYELESLTRSLKYYDNQVSYSTVTMRINEVRSVEPARKAGFGERVSGGLSSTLTGMRDFFVDLAVDLITALPVLIVIFGIAAAVILPIRRHIRKKREERKKKKAEEAQNGGF